jgi:hypothetical protein
MKTYCGRRDQNVEQSLTSLDSGQQYRQPMKELNGVKSPSSAPRRAHAFDCGFLITNNANTNSNAPSGGAPRSLHASPTIVTQQ